MAYSLHFESSLEAMPLFKANTANPKRLYEIVKGVSLKNRVNKKIFFANVN